MVMRTENDNDAGPLHTLKELHIETSRNGRLCTLREGKTQKRHCQQNGVQKRCPSCTQEISYLPAQELATGNPKDGRGCRTGRKGGFFVFVLQKVLANIWNQENGKGRRSRGERVARKNRHVEGIPRVSIVRVHVVVLRKAKGFLVSVFVHESKKPTRQTFRLYRVGCHCCCIVPVRLAFRRDKDRVPKQMARGNCCAVVVVVVVAAIILAVVRIEIVSLQSTMNRTQQGRSRAGMDQWRGLS
mmetsp:Transcript_6105/g.14821  ORF Transcript_6105/g.14821 Transcript_6105/m.14821 type:complete len:243 (-) Transcript_6105:219-947(-)